LGKFLPRRKVGIYFGLVTHKIILILQFLTRRFWPFRIMGPKPTAKGN